MPSPRRKDFKMRRLGQVGTLIAAGVIGFFLSVLIQQAIINSDPSSQACNDVQNAIASCLAPRPSALLSVAGAVIGVAIAWVILRRSHRPRGQIGVGDLPPS
jgi:nicotinamide riboside transporter PnuC